MTDAEQLADLRWHWGGAYKISVEDGVWVAVPHVAPQCVITARSEPELREAIRHDDFTRRPAPTDQGSL